MSSMTSPLVRLDAPKLTMLEPVLFTRSAYTYNVNDSSSTTLPRTATSASPTAGTVTAVATTFLVLAWVTTALRVWVRGRLLQNFGADDVASILAMLCYTVFSVFIIVITQNGGTFHTLDSLRTNFESLVSWTIVGVSFYIATMAIFKLSVGLFFLRIIASTWQTYITVAVMTVNTAYMIAYFFVTLFQCGNPRQMFSFIERDNCLSADTSYGFTLGAGGLSAVTDWILVLLPLIMLRGLGLPRQTKLAVSVILWIGIAGSVVSLIQLKFVIEFNAGNDVFSSGVPIALTSVLEPGFGLIACSLPILRPMFRPLAECSYISNLGQRGNTGSRAGLVSADGWSSLRRLDSGTPPNRSVSRGRPMSTLVESQDDPSLIDDFSQRQRRFYQDHAWSINNTAPLPAPPEMAQTKAIVRVARLERTPLRHGSQG